jgi:hypothetical protein
VLFAWFFPARSTCSRSLPRGGRWQRPAERYATLYRRLAA